MLVGREPEQQRIATLVAGARVRQSGVLVIAGEAGIGKTALLEDTARKADEMQVLRASGSEFEAGLGFSGLHQLLLPTLGLLDHLPAQLRDALEIALTLRSGPAPERFAVGVAALSLLSRCAEDRPLLLLIDDAHLLDPATAETLRFVARRLVADPIALLAFLRPEPDAILYATGLPTLELTGLGIDAATTLIAHEAGGASSPDSAAALHRATAGNPLAIIAGSPARACAAGTGLALSRRASESSIAGRSAKYPVSSMGPHAIAIAGLPSAWRCLATASRAIFTAT